MDLLSKDEPLINLNSFDSAEEGDDLKNEGSLHPRRHSSSVNSNKNWKNRLPSTSKVYLRELSPVRKDQSMERHNSVIVSAVERTMKNYADGVLRVLEGMSGRLSQLELTTQYLEQSISSLKVSVDDYHDNTEQNFKILNERIMETHRAVQILRDKQDIFEAHAQLAKLQTSKALVEKESSGTADSMETSKSHARQELSPQLSLPSEQHMHQAVPSQQHMQQVLPTQQSAQQPPMPPQQPTQQSLQPGQPLLSQSPHILAQQYQSPSLQSQVHGPIQHVPQEAPIQVMQQTSNARTPSEQVQYQGPPQQLQVQQMLPQVTSSPQPLQVTTQQGHQPMEQVRFLPAPPQSHTQQALPQQVAGQQPPQGEAAQLQQWQIQQSPPYQPSVQQPVQVQQPIQGQHAILTQPSPQMQQLPSSHLQGSFQYYGQQNDSQSYSSFAQGTPSFTPGGYATETSLDPTNYAPHQRPPASMSAHQAPQLPPMQKYQVTMAPPHNIPPSQDPGIISGPAMWNRQTNSATPSARLQTAQPVRADYSSTEPNGVVEKVVAMGFSREQVRSVMRRLSERNQSVDMNVVLDILMNGDRGSQGGFSR